MKPASTLVLLAAGIFALGVVAGTRLDAIDTPAAGASAYVEGFRRLDGRAVWDARSADAQDKDARDLYYQDHSASVAMTDRDLATYREKARQDEIRFFDDIRSRGGHIDQIRYFGGHSTGTSGIYVFETIVHQPDGDLDYVWAVMTDREGKVFAAQ
jgi:hypothetical protein